MVSISTSVLFLRLCCMMDNSCRNCDIVFRKTNKGYQRRRSSLIIPNSSGYLCSKCYHHLSKQPKELQVSINNCVIGYYILPVPLRFKICLGKIHQSLSTLPGQTFPSVHFGIITVHVDMGYFLGPNWNLCITWLILQRKTRLPLTHLFTLIFAISG